MKLFTQVPSESCGGGGGGGVQSVRDRFVLWSGVCERVLGLKEQLRGRISVLLRGNALPYSLPVLPSCPYLSCSSRVLTNAEVL